MRGPAEPQLSAGSVFFDSLMPRYKEQAEDYEGGRLAVDLSKDAAEECPLKFG